MMPCSTKCSVPCGIVIFGDRVLGHFEQLMSCSHCSLRHTHALFLSPVYLEYLYTCW
jgi:hypothetical protein